MLPFCSAAHMSCRFCAAHKKLSDWLFASLICGFGLPLSFFLWYFNLYKGAIRDSSFRSAAYALCQLAWHMIKFAEYHSYTHHPRMQSLHKVLLSDGDRSLKMQHNACVWAFHSLERQLIAYHCCLYNKYNMNTAFALACNHKSLSKQAAVFLSARVAICQFRLV